MSIRFSHSHFPCTPDQKAGMGLPWGCLLQPLAPLPPQCSTATHSTVLERCQSCFAYINPYVQYVRSGWKCSICRSINSFQQPRYLSPDDRIKLPELTMSDVEFVWVEETEEARQAQTVGAPVNEDEAAATAAAIDSYRQARDVTSASYDPSATLSAPFTPATVASLSPPAYLFLVDLSGDYNYVETMKASLLAAIEALSPSVWVGLAVFSDKLGLYDLRCSTPCVSFVNIRSAAAAAKYGPSLDEQPTSLSPHALLSLDNFLQQLEHCKEHLCTAIESLISHQKKVGFEELAREVDAEPDFESGTPTHAGGGASNGTGASTSKVKAPRSSPCGFGGALRSLLSYLSSLSHEGFETNIRVLSFLSQRPNWGVGAIEDRVTGTGGEELNEDDWNRFLFQPNIGPMAWSGEDDTVQKGRVSRKSAAQLYQEIGSEASQRGICIDTYIVASSPQQYFDLATLKSLSVLTGGNMIFYPSIAECTLPQDLFRQLRLLQGFRCMLRIRTSPEFHCTNVYGHLTSDPTVENLFHLGGCDARKTYGVEFDFKGTDGFRGGYADVVPVVQVAFTYIGVRIGADGVERVEHKLRILTRQLPLVHFYIPHAVGTKETRAKLRRQAHKQSLTDLYSSSAPDVLLALLVQQVIHASLERGVKESRELVKDWLVAFVMGYHGIFAVKKSVQSPAAPAAASAEEKKSDGAADDAPWTTDSLDMTLGSAPALQFLPRFIFALLKSPLLSPSLDNAVTPDMRVYLQVLYSGLEAEFLVKSIYPTLTSFKIDTDLTQPPASHQQVSLSLHHPVLYLTRYSLSGCGDHIFVLDNYRQLFVFHSGPAASNPALFPLPPPAHSSIAQFLKQIKASTPYLTPKVLCCKEVAPDGGAGARGYYNAAPSNDSSSGAVKDASLRAFLSNLIEDEEGGASSGRLNYSTFLAEVGKEVCERMNAENE